MTELKTLKDIKQIYSTSDPLYVRGVKEGIASLKEDLRYEAITWIKADKSNYYSKLGKEETIIWIKHFFNIEDKDLE